VTFGHEFCHSLGVYALEAGLVYRATLILDPQRRVRHMSLHPLEVGRNIWEILRTLTAIQAVEYAEVPSVTPEGSEPGDTLITIPVEES